MVQPVLWLAVQPPAPELHCYYWQLAPTPAWAVCQAPIPSRLAGPLGRPPAWLALATPRPQQLRSVGPPDSLVVEQLQQQQQQQ